MSETSKLNIVFMGTPPFAAQILDTLLKWDGCNVKAAYCQPDRPAGRGKKLVAPAVKVLAEEYHIPVHQPLNFKNQEDIDILASYAPDILAVAAYGLILPQSVLDIPRIAPLNVHASILPKYRGAAPIQRAIMDGEEETGVSIMHMEAGLDSGPLYTIWALPIKRHTAASLHEVLAELGALALVEILQKMSEGKCISVPQEHEKATHAPKLTKNDGLINWNATLLQVDAQIRAVTHWPGAQICLVRPNKENCEIKVMSGSLGDNLYHYERFLPKGHPQPQAGDVCLFTDGNIAIATADAFYILDEVRPQNKSAMSAKDFARGYLGNEPGIVAHVK